MKLTTTFTAALLCLASAGAWAQAASAPAGTAGIDKRQQAEEQRIGQGQASGQLTRREAHRLERQQARINQAEGAAKADGQVTRGERKRLHAMQGQAGKNIHRQKHDRQHRQGARSGMPPSGPGTGASNAPGG